MLLKVYGKILVSFGLVQNLEISLLAMAKVEIVNITVTYLKYRTWVEVSDSSLHHYGIYCQQL
jgi:hypothetical protein